LWRRGCSAAARVQAPSDLRSTVKAQPHCLECSPKRPHPQFDRGFGRTTCYVARDRVSRCAGSTTCARIPRASVRSSSRVLLPRARSRTGRAAGS
jgi:hypothetical protein